MSNQTPLLALMQIADSSFPAGGFAHSSGLEQSVRDGCVVDAAGVERYIGSVIRLSVATGDAVAASLAAVAMADVDLATVEHVDRALFVTKASSELRTASTSMGGRLLQEVVLHVDEPALRALLGDLHARRTPGTHAAMFGAIGGLLGATPEQAAGALMHSTAMSILQASMRLLPVSHRDVQGALHRLRPEIAALAVRAAATPLDDLRSFHPLQEIASMRHRSATLWLFAS
jgi:urease accessory protein